ncbi:hypothetical protein SAMN05421812_1278 [Asanoa hainanensis]|uniref:Uncharacterized protein n=1 Tax=Asanoa hainanensis TaxID=560556 RepID=A0A239PFN1_9ACTN|nr:hypothetical protein SAMN05421812_1278 [Asanoa hainanensis]
MTDLDHPRRVIRPAVTSPRSPHVFARDHMRKHVGTSHNPRPAGSNAERHARSRSTRHVPADTAWHAAEPGGGRRDHALSAVLAIASADLAGAEIPVSYFDDPDPPPRRSHLPTSQVPEYQCRISMVPTHRQDGGSTSKSEVGSVAAASTPDRLLRQRNCRWALAVAGPARRVPRLAVIGCARSGKSGAWRVIGCVWSGRHAVRRPDQAHPIMRSRRRDLDKPHTIMTQVVPDSIRACCGRPEPREAVIGTVRRPRRGPRR